MNFVGALLNVSIAILIVSGLLSAGMIIKDKANSPIAMTLMVAVSKGLIGIWFLTGLGLLILH